MGSIEGLYPPEPGGSHYSIYLLNHNDWHTGIVVSREDISNGVWERSHFGEFRFLEFGWGDRDYYPFPKPTFWMTLKAAFWPTRSVLHVVGFNASVEKFFPGSEIIEIKVSKKGFENLIGFIQDTYERDEKGEPIELGPGLLENSRFYMAEGKFHVFKTCNVWTAQAIRSAGCPISPFYAISARNTIYQAKDFGKVIRLNE